MLRCGKASITLTRAGKVLFHGTYVSNRSSGVLRLKAVLSRSTNPAARLVMELVNSTRMVAGFTMGIEPSGRELLVVVVKGTFQIPHEW